MSLKYLIVKYLCRHKLNYFSFLLLGLSDCAVLTGFTVVFIGGFQLLDLIITELKSRLFINPRSLIGGNFIFQKNPLQYLLSSLNAVISSNERH